jgi:histidyl-tRNA synthetase
MSRFRLIEGVFRDSCLKCGYEEIRTPTLEYLHLFTSAGTLTPSMLGRVYSFLDWNGWSGERVVLRPDGTIPVARLYIDTMAEKELARLFYITNVFTFEATGEETRERWQFGTELIGVSSTVADVELIALAMEVLRRLGLKGIELRLSHAGLIRVLLAGLGLSPREQTLIFDQMLDGDISALARVKPARPGLGKGLTSLLDLKGKSAGFLKNIKALFPDDLPELKAPLDDFINIVSLLDALGFDYQIDLASGRGFEYYTGVIFQFFNGEEKIGGGGRYDALIPLVGGKDVPASGFALYLGPLMNMVKPETFTGPLPQRVLITAKPLAIKEGFNVANYLRQVGYLAELNLVGQVPAGLKWTLDVRRKAPPFVLTDRLNHRKFELETVDEVAVRLRGGK